LQRIYLKIYAVRRYSHAVKVKVVSVSLWSS